MSARHKAVHVGPNVIAVTWTSSTGTLFTLYRTVPGQAPPRLSWEASGGGAYDTSIHEPERYGAWHVTATGRARTERAAFEAWAEQCIGPMCYCHDGAEVTTCDDEERCMDPECKWILPHIHLAVPS